MTGIAYHGIFNLDPRERSRHGRLQIGMPAGFISEQVAGLTSEYPAGFIGMRSVVKESVEEACEAAKKYD